MGIFNFFTPSKDRELKETLNKISLQIFPGGKEQIDKETEEVWYTLDLKYTREIVKNTYIHIASLYFIEKTDNPENIIKIVMRSKENMIERIDLLKIFFYLKYKSNQNAQQDSKLIDNINYIEDGKKLFLIILGAIFQLKLIYNKELDVLGSFEILLFNSITAIRAYEEIHSEAEMESIEEIIFKHIIKVGQSLNAFSDENAIRNFMNSRLVLYMTELEKFQSSKVYIPDKLYSAFYLSPLSDNLVSFNDFFEMIEFVEGLSVMTKWVYENSKDLEKFIDSNL